MNGGPYRAPQPAERRVINRSGGAAPAGSQGASSTPYRQPDESLIADEPTPRTASRLQESYQPQQAEKKSRKGLIWTLVSLILVICIVGAGWVMWSNAQSGVTGIDTSRYQAVFLSNGQIYFGKMAAFNDESFKISKVYYPEAQTTEGESTQKSTAPQSNIKLIPIVDGVHGPEDEMIISKSQILYYENLKADSQVAQLIERQSK